MALVLDLIPASRIESLVTAAGGSLIRVAGPDQLPPVNDVDLLVVDWGDRGPDWAAAIVAWRNAAGPGPPPRVVLFGPHTDLASHAAARDAGLGPMKARSAFFTVLPGLLGAEGSG